MLGCPQWPRICSLPASASQVAGMIGIYPAHPAVFIHPAIFIHNTRKKQNRTKTKY